MDRRSFSKDHSAGAYGKCQVKFDRHVCDIFKGHRRRPTVLLSKREEKKKLSKTHGKERKPAPRPKNDWRTLVNFNEKYNDYRRKRLSMLEQCETILDDHIARITVAKNRIDLSL